MSERQSYTAIVQWETDHGDHGTRKKKIMAGNLTEALDMAIESEQGPGRAVVWGTVKLTEEFRNW